KIVVDTVFRRINCYGIFGHRLCLNRESDLAKHSAMSTEVSKNPIYQRLAAEFSSLIQRGQLKPGERLPSVRRLATQRQVSISTALQSLRALENCGLVEARPQSGYFVRRPASRLEEPIISRPPRTPGYVGITGMVT